MSFVWSNSIEGWTPGFFIYFEKSIQGLLTPVATIHLYYFKGNTQTLDSIGPCGCGKASRAVHRNPISLSSSSHWVHFPLFPAVLRGYVTTLWPTECECEAAYRLLDLTLKTSQCSTSCSFPLHTRYGFQDPTRCQEVWTGWSLVLRKNPFRNPHLTVLWARTKPLVLVRGWPTLTRDTVAPALWHAVSFLTLWDLPSI